MLKKCYIINIILNKSQNKIIYEELLSRKHELITVKVKSKLLIITFSLIIIGLIYSATEIEFPRDHFARISMEGSSCIEKLVKEEQNNHHYIIFREYYYNGNLNTVKVECTKEQYDFIQSGKEYHLMV